MERRDERVSLEALKDRFAILENDLDMAYRRVKALLTENKELKEEVSKMFSLYVGECSKNRPEEKVAGWKKVNPEGLKSLQNPKILDKSVQTKGYSRASSLKMLSKTIDLLERIPR